MEHCNQTNEIITRLEDRVKALEAHIHFLKTVIVPSREAEALHYKQLYEQAMEEENRQDRKKAKLKKLA